MKSLAGVLIALALVVAVAVAGSQARPLPRANPLLQICEQTGPIVLDSARCKPVVLLAAPGELERDFVGDIGGDWANDAGGNGADPDWQAAAVKAVVEVAWRAAVAAASVNFVQRALDWAFGDTGASHTHFLAHLDTSIFDPVQ